MDDRRDEWIPRLRVAAYLAAAVALVVAVALANGCAPVVAPDGTTQESPTTSPVATTTGRPSPTSVPSANFDGTYGPGVFTRGVDSCNPSFFDLSFTGSALVVNDETSVSLFESKRRDSSCVFNAATQASTCSGSGLVGSTPETWREILQFSRDAGNQPHLVVTDTVSLTSPDCGATYVSTVLNRQ